jgi:uncharacterized SAM-binding protein YcdF (DUF218 family)
VGAFRRHPIVTGLVLVLFAAVAVVGVTGVAVFRAAHVDDASFVDHADAIVVLGAAEYNGTPSPVFLGRLQHAVLLYRQGRAPVVIALGGKQPGDPTTEGDAGRAYLVAHGVPSSAAVGLPIGRTTYESLTAAAQYMKTHAMSSAFLVSDPWHNLRIERMAADLGITGYASATWTSAAKSEQTRIPGYARETFAYLYYRLFHR